MKYIPAVFVFCLVIYATIMADLGVRNPLITFVKEIPEGDKFAHFLIYGLFAFSLSIATNFHRTQLFGKSILTGSACILVFAIGEEFTQLAFPTRNFDFIDMLCDIVGIILFSKLALKWYNKEPNHKKLVIGAKTSE